MPIQKLGKVKKQTAGIDSTALLPQTAYTIAEEIIWPWY